MDVTMLSSRFNLPQQERQAVLINVNLNASSIWELDNLETEHRRPLSRAAQPVLCAQLA